MARRPKWTDDDKAALQRLVDRYGVADVIREAAAKGTPFADELKKEIAGLLLDHAKTLKSGLSNPQWIGLAELQRRAAYLVGTFRSKALPEEILQLVAFLLIGDRDPWSGRHGDERYAFMAAALEEAEYPVGENGELYAANVVSAVAKAAGVDRTTIRGWREHPAYRDVVCDARLARELTAARRSGASEDELDEMISRSRRSGYDSLTTGLRLTTPGPWGKK